MQTVLHELEEYLLRGAVESARILGVSYSNYAAMKAGSRPLPTYVAYHAKALMALDRNALHRLIRERLHGG